MRKRLLGEQSTPVTLLAPVQIESWLHFYDIEIEQISSEFALVSNRDLVTRHDSALNNCNTQEYFLSLRFVLDE